MRAFDDDENIQHYAPVLRRIIMLIAVIVAVPVVLWTITAFMRTYIAQPVIPAPKPLAAVTAPMALTPTADAGTNDAAPAAAAAPPAPATAAVAEARAMAIEARGDLSAKRDAAADTSGNTPASDTATTASVQPMAPLPAAGMAANTAKPQVAPSASDIFPNPPAAFAAPQQQAQMPAMPAAPAAGTANTADDALPPPDPIAGPVPMPRHRPSVFALVETGVVPLPRARPAEAPEPEKPVTDTPNIYDPGLGAR